MSGYCYTVLYYPEVDSAYLPQPGDEVSLIGPVFATRREAVLAMNSKDELPAIKQDRLPVEPYLVTLRENADGSVRMVEAEHATDRRKNPTFAGMYPFFIDTGPDGPPVDIKEHPFQWGGQQPTGAPGPYQQTAPPSPEQTRTEPQQGRGPAPEAPAPQYREPAGYQALREQVSSLHDTVKILVEQMRGGEIYRAEDIEGAIEEAADLSGDSSEEVAEGVAEEVGVTPTPGDVEDTAYKVSSAVRSDLADQGKITEEEAEDTPKEEGHSRDMGWNLSDVIYERLVDRFSGNTGEGALELLASQCPTEGKAGKSLRALQEQMAADPEVSETQDRVYTTKRGRANTPFRRAFNKAMLRLFGFPEDFALKDDEGGTIGPAKRQRIIIRSVYRAGKEMVSGGGEDLTSRTERGRTAQAANTLRLNKEKILPHLNEFITNLREDVPEDMDALLRVVDTTLGSIEGGTIRQNVANNRRILIAVALQNWPGDPYKQNDLFRKSQTDLLNLLAERLGVGQYAEPSESVSLNAPSTVFQPEEPEVPSAPSTPSRPTTPSTQGRTRREPVGRPEPPSASNVRKQIEKALEDVGLDQKTQTFMLDMLKGLLKNEGRAARYTPGNFAAFQADLTPKAGKAPPPGSYPFPYLPWRAAAALALSLGYYTTNTGGQVRGDLKAFYDDVIVNRNFDGESNHFSHGAKLDTAGEAMTYAEATGGEGDDPDDALGALASAFGQATAMLGV